MPADIGGKDVLPNRAELELLARAIESSLDAVGVTGAVVETSWRDETTTFFMELVPGLKLECTHLCGVLDSDLAGYKARISPISKSRLSIKLSVVSLI